MGVVNNAKISVSLSKKKSYETPLLLEYGRIANLTLGTLSAGNDSGAGFKNKKGPVAAPGNNSSPVKKRR